MADEMTPVPAVVPVREDTVHAWLAFLARVDHLSQSRMVRELKDAIPERDRTRAQLVVCVAERERVIGELKRRRDQAPPGVVRDTWIAALVVVLGGAGQERSDEKAPQP